MAARVTTDGFNTGSAFLVRKSNGPLGEREPPKGDKQISMGTLRPLFI